MLLTGGGFGGSNGGGGGSSFSNGFDATYFDGVQNGDGYVEIRYVCICNPTTAPTALPTAPTAKPTANPTLLPTASPTIVPTRLPTLAPTVLPTFSPSFIPTNVPSTAPTPSPTIGPSRTPTIGPNSSPTYLPTAFPTPKNLCETNTTIFRYTGYMQQYHVASCASYIIVDAAGARGGDVPGNPDPGLGARVQEGYLPIQGGSVLYIFVAGAGSDAYGAEDGGLGGYNGGGNPGVFGGTGGGGASDSKYFLKFV